MGNSLKTGEAKHRSSGYALYGSSKERLAHGRSTSEELWQASRRRREPAAPMTKCPLPRRLPTARCTAARELFFTSCQSLTCRARTALGELENLRGPAPLAWGGAPDRKCVSSRFQPPYSEAALASQAIGSAPSISLPRFSTLIRHFPLKQPKGRKGASHSGDSCQSP